MGTVTAKQLKQHTGEWIKRLLAGEILTLTYRGKAVAKIEPIIPKKQIEDSNSEAWKDIENALKISEQQFKNWKEASNWARSRK